MTRPRNVEPVLRVCAVIASSGEWIEAAINELVTDFGQPVVRSAPIDFDPGGFYRASMGEGLSKVLCGFESFVQPDGLADWKRMTNAREDEWSTRLATTVERPINLDPGYVSQAKLVLATVKDRDHRLYLRQGIFAEVTLNYVGGQWIDHRWTYPSYRDPQAKLFVAECRRRLREHILRNGLTRRAE